MSPSQSNDRRWSRTAVVLWSLLALLSSVRVLVDPDRQHFRIFHAAGIDWWSGASLFERADHLFRYSPAFAVLASPFALLPLGVSNILWNVVTLLLLSVAVIQLSHRVLPGTWTAKRRAQLLLLTLPGVIRGIWSSQSHGLTAVCLLFALVGITRRRWWLSSLLLAVAFHVKLAPLVLAMLLCVMWPWQLGPRYLICLIGLGLLPFLTQDPSFVTSQYVAWWDYLRESSDLRWVSNRDLWNLWESSGLPFSVPVYRGIQIAVGAATAAWCLWLSRSRLCERQQLTVCAAIGLAYMLVLGPAVEFQQYVIIAPFIGWAVLHDVERRGRSWPIIGIWFMTLIMGFGGAERLLGRVFGVAAVTQTVTLGTILFAVWLVAYARSGARQANGEITTMPGPP